MVEVGLVLDGGTLVLIGVLLWRIWIVEEALYDRVDEIDRSLGGVVGMILEKMEDMASRAVSVTENPIGQILEFLSQGKNSGGVINTHKTPPRSTNGQFVEVEANAPKKEEDTKA